ncbi:uncharacterized protein Z519_01361 [Cladophialophora bantiana CBS 173.52]|uniref:Metallo-beta-lactamase domain-containing protein n=1 Tax=Cladophialophora bantiana (strain ATCC 10958 / CBS 173.52 / CDC B-1940 / NIH 8579) TaxID=1442370 RepID=A0A0D2GHD6_CLAB1|nr:uncharacterized protein Z519_01361 [Cladophialophora bantiana CBS 173.52]KIW97777.1 hypothetical protein Z519_01361 [Cladophialophora bantiana CBS 173.52]
MEAAREKTLQTHFASPAPNRPIITSLNGDNSWLLSFPRPSADRATTGRAYYHIVFEPWLNGPTSQFSSWIIHLMLPNTPAFTTPEAITAVARQIEAAAAEASTITADKVPKGDDVRHGQDIDAIFLGFHYLDHVHEPTLRLFDPSIPVIATPEAQGVIRPWNHFTTILTISSLDAKAKLWRGHELHPGEPFPLWLTPIRLLGHHELNYVMAIIWTHSTGNGNEVHEAILQSPHGTKLDSGPLEAFLGSEPETEKLALLHGLKESRAAGWLNTYGAASGLALYRRVGGTKYWVPTHSAPLHYSGIFMRLLRVNDTPRTLQWALDKEKQNDSKALGPSASTPNLTQVENGGCLVLS